MIHFVNHTQTANVQHASLAIPTTKFLTFVNIHADLIEIEEKNENLI